jgi:integrase
MHRPEDGAIVRSEPHTVLAPSTAEDIWDAALTHVIAENSRRSYRTGMASFARFLLSTRRPDQRIPDSQRDVFLQAADLLTSVTFNEVAAYREELRAQDLSPATINNRLAAVSTVFVRMMRMNLIRDNPAKPELVARMRVSNVSTTPGLTRSEGLRVLKACAKDGSSAGRRDLAMLALLIFNGLRRSEIASMDVDGFRIVTGPNGDDVPIYIILGKGGKKRTIEVVPVVWDAVVDWMEHGKLKAGPLFRPARRLRDGSLKVIDRRLTTRGIYDIVVRRIRAAGIAKPVSPHGLRHTFATLALTAGQTLQAVQIALGHSDPSTTFRYLRVVDQVGRSPSRSIGLDWNQEEEP